MRNNEKVLSLLAFFFPLFLLILAKMVKTGEDRRVHQEEVFLTAAGCI